MMNTSYLCCCDHAGIYPSFSVKDYDAEQSTIACDVMCVPAVWVAMFRSKDIREEKFTVDKESIAVRAPVTSVEAALQELEAALPVLNQWFKSQGKLDDHIAALSAAIASSGGKFLTIEWQEIEDIAGEGFWRQVNTVLSFLDQPDMNDTLPLPMGRLKNPPALQKSVSNRARHALLSLASVEVVTAFTSPVGFWDRDVIPEDEEVMLCRLLGASHFRPCSWDGTDSSDAGDEVFVVPPEDEAMIRAEGAERLAKEAAKDAAITDCVCPHCGQPCPPYRKTCKHCKKEVRGML